MKPILIALSLFSLWGCGHHEENIIDSPTKDSEIVTVHFSGRSIETHLTKTETNLPAGSTIRVYALKRTGATAAPATDRIASSKCYEVQSDGSLVVCTVDNDGSIVTGYDDTAMQLITGDYDFYCFSPAKALDVNRSLTLTNGVDFIANTAPISATITRVVTQTISLSSLKHYCHFLSFVFTLKAGLSYSLDIGDGVTLNTQPTTASYTLGDAALTVGGSTDDYLIGTTNFTLTDNVVTGGTVVIPRTTTGISIIASLKINTWLRVFGQTTISTIEMTNAQRSTSRIEVNYTTPNNDPMVDLILGNITISPWINQSPETITPPEI